MQGMRDGSGREMLMDGLVDRRATAGKDVVFTLTATNNGPAGATNVAADLAQMLGAGKFQQEACTHDPAAVDAIRVAGCLSIPASVARS